MPVKVLIADDDAGMRLVLRRIVESMEGFAIAGEAENGRDAVTLAAETKPDVVFLDVEMPELNGTDAAKLISAALPDTAQVFVTAHSEYMPAAFEVYAFDYLVKPFKTDRVRQTLQRFARTLKTGITGDGGSLVIKSRDGMEFVPVKDIIMVCRDERVTQIVTASGSYTSPDSLTDIWPKLEGRGFVRCHRAYIVRAASVTKLYPYGRWTYTAKLRGTDRDALVTHDKLGEIQRVLGAL